MRHLCASLLFIISWFSIYSQDSLRIMECYVAQPPKNLPNTLGTHPFGVYISRISHNFSTNRPTALNMIVNYSSGNVWLPNVKAYKPQNSNYNSELQNYEWHDKERVYDFSAPADSFQLHADGIYRVININFSIPISKKQELRIGARGFSVDNGSIPYSVINSDDFLEWFHSNVAGGEDPFNRKLYGFNKTDVRYQDIEGKEISITRGHTELTGLQSDYYIYPTWEKLSNYGLYTNHGAHLGWNLSSINPSIDFGLSSGIIKKHKIRNNMQLDIGLSLAALRQGIYNFESGVQISSNPFLLSSNLMAGFSFYNKKGALLTIATTWWRQNSYFNKNDFDNIVLTGPRNSPHWHLTMTHLYSVITANNFIFSYQRLKYSLSIYLREDLKVNNAPDSQTGIEFRYFIP